MNNETITGNCDSNGLFTAKNPHVKKFSGFEYTNFESAHPPLFCYNENNVLVKGVEGLEVKGPCYQFLSEDWSSGKKIQTWVNGNDGDRPFPTYKSYSKYWNDRKFETRQVYIAVQPTEKSNKGYNETVHPLPEAQPLEGMKTAQINIGETSITKLVDDCVQIVTKNGYVELYPDELTALFTFTNAQFATEAGAGVDNDLLICLRQMLDFSDKWGKEWFTKDQWNMIDNCKKVASKNYIVTNGAGFHIPSTDPSTHSSSEMVEDEKVVYEIDFESDPIFCSTPLNAYEKVKEMGWSMPPFKLFEKWLLQDGFCKISGLSDAFIRQHKLINYDKSTKKII